MLQFLVVEPDDAVSDLLREELQEIFGACIAQAENGERAMQVLHHRALDLVVIEAMLPDMSGFELAERAAYRNVPALLISGRPAKQETCRAYGYPHLEKPFSLHDLAHAARTLIRDGQQAIVRLHRSYEKLTATFGVPHLVAEAARQTKVEADQIRSAPHQIRDEISGLRIEGAAARFARRSPSGPTAFGQSTVLLKIVVLHHLLLEIGIGLGPEVERTAKLLLAEEEAKLAALDATKRGEKPLC